MSKLVDEAVETLRIANDKMAQLSDAFCENAKNRAFRQAISCI